MTSLFAALDRARRPPRRRGIRAVAAWLLFAWAELGYGAAPPYEVPDTIAQRAQACVTCHGKEGRATSYGYFPRIAGKPAGYLYNQLVNFREGRRHYAAMTYLVEHLSDAYLQEFAEYFASLDLPYPPPHTAGVPRELLARGETLVLRGDPARGIPACAQCHGAALTGVAPSIPGLLGLSSDYVMGQFAFWSAGQRRAAAPDCMERIIARLAADDIRALAMWLSSQPVPKDAKPAARIELPLPMACGSGPK